MNFVFASQDVADVNGAFNPSPTWTPDTPSANIFQDIDDVQWDRTPSPSYAPDTPFEYIHRISTTSPSYTPATPSRHISQGPYGSQDMDYSFETPSIKGVFPTYTGSFSYDVSSPYVRSGYNEDLYLPQPPPSPRPYMKSNSPETPALWHQIIPIHTEIVHETMGMERVQFYAATVTSVDETDELSWRTNKPGVNALLPTVHPTALVRTKQSDREEILNWQTAEDDFAIPLGAPRCLVQFGFVDWNGPPSLKGNEGHEKRLSTSSSGNAIVRGGGLKRKAYCIDAARNDCVTKSRRKSW